jgi:hypothetical protein
MKQTKFYHIILIKFCYLLNIENKYIIETEWVTVAG